MNKYITEYEKEAQVLLHDAGIRLTVTFLRHGPYFQDDETSRDVYLFSLSNGECSYFAEFGDSVMNSELRKIHFPSVESFVNFNASARGVGKNRWERPGAYSILSCLTKSDPGDFEEFCMDYGFDVDSIRARNTYEAVCKEWEGVRALFRGEALERFQEII